MRLGVEHPRSGAFLVAMCQDCLLTRTVYVTEGHGKTSKGTGTASRAQAAGMCAVVPGRFPGGPACHPAWHTPGCGQKQLAVEPRALSAHIWAHWAALCCGKVFRPHREFLPARLSGARWPQAGQVSVTGRGGVRSGLQPHHRGFVPTGHTRWAVQMDSAGAEGDRWGESHASGLEWGMDCHSSTRSGSV